MFCYIIIQQLCQSFNSSSGPFEEYAYMFFLNSSGLWSDFGIGPPILRSLFVSMSLDVIQTNIQGIPLRYQSWWRRQLSSLQIVYRWQLSSPLLYLYQLVPYHICLYYCPSPASHVSGHLLQLEFAPDNISGRLSLHSFCLDIWSGWSDTFTSGVMTEL